ncbi:hypothetical protein Pcinc_021089 [Petrolisthes cinctipes]|uniref:SHSP domain-containing protein n=1 Tax=Petrolisthes cinctipes TaxID=88211 RepID=A0AAE1FIW7_PETCI|nr:hypothetical protein Pcinc_021089 [Petrolisthes cinctipes]
MAPITDELVQFPKIFNSSARKNKKYTDLMTFSLPISHRGLFLQDSIFEYAYAAFDEAVRRILEGWGERISVDEVKDNTKLRLSSNLSRYRQLRPHNLKEKDQAVVLTADTNTNRIVMDVYGLMNKELNVKVVGEQQVMVEGRLETNGDFPLSSSSFRRSFSLPQDTNMECISSVMSLDGILTIIAPRTADLKMQSREILIPVKLVGEGDSCVPRPSPFLDGCWASGLRASNLQARHTIKSFIRSKIQQSEADTFREKIMKCPIFPIPTLGAFFSDPFFKESWEAFQEAVREVLLRWGDLTTTANPLTRYRTLRATHLREDNQAMWSSEDDHNYKVVLDVQDFIDGGDICVQFINPREIVIKGHVGNNTTNSKAEKFLCHFVLPGEVDMDGASSVMSADGVLTVTAPKKTTHSQMREIMLPVTLDQETPADTSVRPYIAVPTRSEASVTSLIHPDPEPPLVTSPIQSPRDPEPVETPIPVSILEPEPRVTSPILMFITEPKHRVTSPIYQQPRESSPHQMSTQALEAQITANKLTSHLEPRPRVLSPILESRVTSPTRTTNSQPEPQVTSPNPQPRVTSPAPSDVSEDDCDSPGKLWTFCPHGVVIEEIC